MSVPQTAHAPHKSVTLAVVGATGSGKSAAVMALAAQRPVEVVSCDSVQLYRGFDLGSAKPSPAERAAVSHHLVDVADWDVPYDVARYVAAAAAAVAAVQAGGALPVVCGGSGLYLRALRRGLAPLPPVDHHLRERLRAEELGEPGRALRRLRALDPEAAANVDARNPQRVLRALEICEQAGQPLRVLWAQPSAQPPLPLRVLQLQWPAALLRERLAARSAAMLSAGLLDEVAALLAAGVAPTCQPMRSVGYRQAAAVLRGEAPVAGLAARIAAASWQYARRQHTWLRREVDVAVVPVASAAAAADAVAAAARDL